MGYEGGGCRRSVWWRKRAADKQLWATLEEILQVSKDQEATGRDIHAVGKRGRQRSREGSWDDGTDMGDAWVGGWICAVGGDYGTETGNAWVGE